MRQCVIIILLLYLGLIIIIQTSVEASGLSHLAHTIMHHLKIQLKLSLNIVSMFAQTVVSPVPFSSSVAF